MILDEDEYGDDIPTPSPQEEEIANTEWLPVVSSSTQAIPTRQRASRGDS